MYHLEATPPQGLMAQMEAQLSHGSGMAVAMAVLAVQLVGMAVHGAMAVLALQTVLLHMALLEGHQKQKKKQKEQQKLQQLLTYQWWIWCQEEMSIIVMMIISQQ